MSLALNSFLSVMYALFLFFASISMFTRLTLTLNASSKSYFMAALFDLRSTM